MSTARIAGERWFEMAISDEKRREIAQELRRYAVYGEDETLLGWWVRCISSPRAMTTSPTCARCLCALLD